MGYKQNYLQVLYYIHYRVPIQSSIDVNDAKTQPHTTPTLSGFQFHDDMPHETVVSILIIRFFQFFFF